MTYHLKKPVITRDASELFLFMAVMGKSDPLGYYNHGGTLNAVDETTGRKIQHPSDIRWEHTDEINRVDEIAASFVDLNQHCNMSHILKYGQDAQTDIITAKLLNHVGVRAPAAMILGKELEKQATALEIEDSEDESQGKIKVTVGYQNTLVMIGKAIMWSSYGVITAQAFPETVLSAACGKPLKAFLSHPVLDRFDLTIDVVHNQSEIESTIRLKRDGWQTTYGPAEVAELLEEGHVT